MPYRRAYRSFYLTPPSVPIFLASVVIAILAVLTQYGHLALVRPFYAFLALLIAYLLLVAGVLLRGI